MRATRQTLVVFHMAVALTQSCSFEACTRLLTFKSVGLRHTEESYHFASFARVWVPCCSLFVPDFAEFGLGHSRTLLLVIDPPRTLGLGYGHVLDPCSESL